MVLCAGGSLRASGVVAETPEGTRTIVRVLLDVLFGLRLTMLWAPKGSGAAVDPLRVERRR